MKTTQHTSFVLSDQETLLLLDGFCYEALRFLRVPIGQYPTLKIGALMEEDGRADPLFINYDKSKVLVFIPIFRLMFTSMAGNDAPTLFRTVGYQIARFWHRFIMEGRPEPFDVTDEDSLIFSYACTAGR